MGRDKAEAVSVHGPIFARDIITAGRVIMTLCFHSRGGETEGKKSGNEKESQEKEVTKTEKPTCPTRWLSRQKRLNVAFTPAGLFLDHQVHM